MNTTEENLTKKKVKLEVLQTGFKHKFEDLNLNLHFHNL